ncbi:MAG: hypothetical protein HFE39_01265 [Clostridiales bacterium]|jgi:hypothetical protein|nr:hypothetical protein [Clostridiales bacterium]
MKTLLKLLGVAAVAGGAVYAVSKWKEKHPRYSDIGVDDIPEVDDDWDDFEIAEETKSDEEDCTVLPEQEPETVEE